MATYDTICMYWYIIANYRTVQSSLVIKQSMHIPYKIMVGSMCIPPCHHCHRPSAMASMALPVLCRGSTWIATEIPGECGELPLVELPLVPQLVRGSWRVLQCFIELVVPHSYVGEHNANDYQ